MEEEPDELLVRLADESKNAGLSIEDWLEFLVSLKEETTHWIRMAEKDLEKS